MRTLRHTLFDMTPLSAPDCLFSHRTSITVDAIRIIYFQSRTETWQCQYFFKPHAGAPFSYSAR